MVSPVNSAPWRQLAGPTTNELYLLGLACGPEGLTARVTDMRGWWEGRLDLATVDARRKEQKVNTPATDILTLVARCFGADADVEGKYAFIVAPADGAVRLTWSCTGMALEIICQPDSNPAARLRDELILPLLRGVELLESLVDPAAASAWAAGPPPADAIPLPNFHRPLIRRLLSSAVAPGASSSNAALAERDGRGGSGETELAPERGAASIVSASEPGVTVAAAVGAAAATAPAQADTAAAEVEAKRLAKLHRKRERTV